MSIDAAASRELSQKLRKRGGIILALFALVWVVAGQSGLPSAGAAREVVLVAGAVLTLVAVILAIRSGALPPSRDRTLPAAWYRGVGRVNLAQFVAIVVVLAIFRVAGWPMLIPPAICLIVGVHFLPLARLFGQPQYRWTGVCLIAVAVAGFVIVAAGGGAGLTLAVVGFGAAGVLLGSALHVVLRG